MMEDPIKLLTPRECAAIRRVTVGHQGNERSRGQGPPYVKIGGRVFYPAQALREYIEAHLVNPAAKAG